MASLFEEAIRIFSKPSSERTDHECRVLVPWLRQLSPLLEPHAIEVLIDFIQNCQYQQAATDHVLIWRGKFTQSYSLIIKGSASLHLDAAQARDDITSASISPLKDADTCDAFTQGTSRFVPNVERRQHLPRHPTESTNCNGVTGHRYENKKIGQSPKSAKFLTTYGSSQRRGDSHAHVGRNTSVVLHGPTAASKFNPGVYAKRTLQF